MLEMMRRKDRLLPEEEAKEILLREKYGVLSTIGADGYPYGVPISYAYADGKIYMHGAAETGAKFKNMQSNHKVCFTVIGSTKVLPNQFSTLYESVIVFGTASRLTDTAEKQRGLEAIITKYSPEFQEEGMQYIVKMGGKADVYAIVPEQITGKAKR